MRSASLLPASATRRVLILEPDLDGHHAFWLSLIIEAYGRAGWAVELLTTGDASRLSEQLALRGHGAGRDSGARFHAAPENAGEAELLARARALARETGADEIFVAFLDRYWSAILAEGHGAEKLTGIWFHPHALDARWRWLPPLDKRWKTHGRVHRFLRSGRASHKLAKVFFTVPEPAARLARLNPRILTQALPDPFEREPSLGRSEARERLGLPSDRFIFLHIGSSERRKGLPDALAAFARLAKGRVIGAGGRRPLLLRVGSTVRLKGWERGLLDKLLSEDLARTVETFVSAEEFMEYFSAADRVLITYRKFRYSSGILANAIGAGRAVIAADYGEIGREVAERGLGELYRVGSVAGLAEAMGRALADIEAPRAAAAADRAARTPEVFVARLAEGLGYRRTLP